MREFIGHSMKVAAEVLGIIEGVLIDDRPNMILIKGKDGKITRVVKAGIKGFVPNDFEPVDYKPFHVLFCENKKLGCSGVQYIKSGEGFTQSDLDVFMSPCPCKCVECKMGTKGELRSVSSEFLKMMLDGSMFGEYPNKESKNGRAGHTAAVGSSSKGKSKG